MLYLGHFSFHGSHQEGEQQYGFFNCVIEADSVERATELIRVHIQKVKASDDLFDGVDEPLAVAWLDARDARRADPDR